VKKALLVAIEIIISLVLIGVYVGVVLSNYERTRVLNWFPDVQLLWPLALCLVFAGVAALIYRSTLDKSTDREDKEEGPSKSMPVNAVADVSVVSPRAKGTTVLGTTASGQVVTKGPGIGNYRQIPVEQFGSSIGGSAARRQLRSASRSREHDVERQLARIRYAYNRVEAGRTPIVDHAGETIAWLIAGKPQGKYELDYRAEGVILETESIDSALVVVRKRERRRLLGS
jgi:hypothetical protein